MTEQILKVLCSNKKINLLRRREDRQKLASHIQQITNYYSFNEILFFVEEMRGLDLRKDDEQQLFLKFFECWLSLEG